MISQQFFKMGKLSGEACKSKNGPNVVNMIWSSLIPIVQEVFYPSWWWTSASILKSRYFTHHDGESRRPFPGLGVVMRKGGRVENAAEKRLGLERRDEITETGER